MPQAFCRNKAMAKNITNSISLLQHQVMITAPASWQQKTGLKLGQYHLLLATQR
jgi:hypothetical protein